MGNWKKIKEKLSLSKDDNEILKELIKRASKQRFPNRGYKENFYMDESKEVEQPAFTEGVKWAILEFGLDSRDYIKGQIELLKWLQREIGSDFSISPNETYEKLVERFNKQK